MSSASLISVTGSSTGNASEKIGQNATIVGEDFEYVPEIMTQGDFVELDGQSNTGLSWTGMTNIGNILYVASRNGGRIYYRDIDVSGDFILMNGQTLFRNYYGITTSNNIIYVSSDDFYPDGGRVYFRSKDVSGNFIELPGQATNRNWRGLFVDGDILYGVTTTRVFSKHVDSGSDFIELGGQTIDRSWNGITVKDEYIYVTTSFGRIYYRHKYTDGDFIELEGQTVNRGWGIGITTIGDYIYTVGNSRVYYREINVQGDFIQLEGQTVNRSWDGITSIENILYASVVSNKIYKANTTMVDAPVTDELNIRSVSSIPSSVVYNGEFYPLPVQSYGIWYGITNIGDFIYMAGGTRIFYKLKDGDIEPAELDGQTFDRSWRGITAIGDVLYVMVSNGRIYSRHKDTSGDFIELEGQTLERSWVAITAIGDVLYATVSNGRIYSRHKDISGDFIELEGQTVNRDWMGITSIGDVLYVTVSNGRIYSRHKDISGDFIELEGQTVSRNWGKIVSIGDELFVTVSYDGIYSRHKNHNGDFMKIMAFSVYKPWRDITVVGYVLYLVAWNGPSTGLIYRSPTPSLIYTYQNITDHIQSSSETEIVFQTPNYPEGDYKLAVERLSDLSNELDFTILLPTQVPESPNPIYNKFIPRMTPQESFGGDSTNTASKYYIIPGVYRTTIIKN